MVTVRGHQGAVFFKWQLGISHAFTLLINWCRSSMKLKETVLNVAATRLVTRFFADISRGANADWPHH